MESIAKKEWYSKKLEPVNKEPEKYVITNESFSMASKGNVRLIQEFDEERGSEYQTVKRPGKDEIHITTYEPIKGYPGLYDVKKRTYEHGEQQMGVETSVEALTWKDLKAKVQESQKAYDEQVKAGGRVPGSLLAVTDGKSIDAIQKEWEKGKKILLSKEQPKENKLTSLKTRMTKAVTKVKGLRHRKQESERGR